MNQCYTNAYVKIVSYKVLSGEIIFVPLHEVEKNILSLLKISQILDFL